MDFDLPDTALAVRDGVCAVGAKYDHANIAPSNIENLLKESPLVGHALVFGEGRPYVVAVLTTRWV